MSRTPSPPRLSPPRSRRRSPPPQQASSSHSPLRDAISLVIDSDDDSSDDDDGSVQMTHAPPELASTHSDSCPDDGGHDHADVDDDAPPVPSTASGGTDGSAASEAMASALGSAPKLTAAELVRHEKSTISGAQPLATIRNPLSAANSRATSGISRWRRRDMSIATGGGRNSTNAPQSKSQCYNTNNAIDITPLHQIPYVHGGYAAAAPLLVTHATFATILKKVLPGAYDELGVLLRTVRTGAHKYNGRNGTRGRSASSSGNSSDGGGNAAGNGARERGGSVVDQRPPSGMERLASCASPYEEGEGGHGEASNPTGSENGNLASAEVVLPDPVKVMKWAENNPVVSAFGIWNSDSGRRTIKFMQGIDLNYDAENNPSNGGEGCHNRNRGLFNDVNDRESVVTLGSTFSQGFGGSNVRGTGRQNNLPYAQRSRRRKQPVPEDDPAGGGADASPPRYGKPALEWDVFLDPQLVRQVDAALGVVDGLNVKLRKARMRRERRTTAKTIMKKQSPKREQTNDDDDDDDSDNDDDDDFDILQSHTAAQVEVDRLVAQLLRRTVIAHGSMSQLVLEAVGVAPKYNFGTVVQASRDRVDRAASMGGRDHPASPSGSRRHVSIRAGNAELSLAVTQTMSWDEDEEQRDFEALLDPSMMGNGAGRGDGGRRRRKTSAGSKGMFMENWLHVFARTLSLLVKSSSNNAITKKSSSSSSSNGSGVLAVKNRPANIGQRGLSGLLERMFRRDSSYRGPLSPETVEGPDERSFDLDQIKEAADDNDRNQLLDLEDDNSDRLTNNDMFLPQTPTAATSALGGLCGMSLCLGYGDDGDSSKSTFPLNPHASHKMAQDIERITGVLGEPLRLVLDLKSRRVPPRVWSRLIDSLRTRGLIIEGIGSFDMDELRIIGKGCSYPLTPILFFHSVGDLQRACHANEVKNGDTVYFNGGSLMWKRSRIMEAAERGCCGTIDTDDIIAASGDVVSGGRLSSPKVGGSSNYSFQPYAYPRSALSDWEKTMCKSTIEDYRRHFNLKIGVYVQEFSISAEALDALTLFVNKHGSVYDQGLAFGGINGTAVKNIRGDGYWNQRYMGRSWDFDARPSKEMTPLEPGDHHLVQKAIQAGAWGQVGTIFEVNDENQGALTVVSPPQEPCNMVNTY